MRIDVKDAKPNRKVDCWNCGGNHYARDCTFQPAKKDGDKKGKVNVTFRDDYDDYGDGVLLTRFENAKMASPGCFLLQYKTDDANDVSVQLKRLNVIAMRVCPTVGSIVEELEYCLPEEVGRPDFAAIVDEHDRYIARQMYQRRWRRV